MSAAKRTPAKYFKDINDEVILIIHFRHACSRAALLPVVCLFARYLASTKGFPGGSDGKESVCKVGIQGSIPGLGRSSGEGNGNQPQYSCLQNSMDI